MSAPRPVLVVDFGAAGVVLGAVDRTPPEFAQVVVGEEFEVVFEHEP